MFNIGVSDKVFWFMGFYIFFLIFLGALIVNGLPLLVSNVNNVNVTSPTLNPPATPANCTGFWCTLTGWGDAITNAFNYVYYFFANISFLFSLSIANPFSAVAYLTYLFTFFSIMFIICILLVIRG